MAGLLGAKTPAMPVIPTPVVMPTENTAAVTQSQQQQLQAAAVRSGRASTILSQQNASKQSTTDTLGGE